MSVPLVPRLRSSTVISLSVPLVLLRPSEAHRDLEIRGRDSAEHEGMMYSGQTDRHDVRCLLTEAKHWNITAVQVTEEDLRTAVQVQRTGRAIDGEVVREFELLSGCRP